jgi:hypothetical protein
MCHKDGTSKGNNKDDNPATPKCIPVPVVASSCKCTHPDSTNANENGMTCTDPKTNKELKDVKFCGTTEKCTQSDKSDTKVACTTSKGADTQGSCPTDQICSGSDTSPACANQGTCTGTCFKTTSQAAKCVPLAGGCTCDKASGTDSGMTCSNGKGHTACTKGTVCVGDPGKASCKGETCKCDTSGTTGGGNNGFTCTKPDGTTRKDTCIDAKMDCTDDPSNSDSKNPGIQCGAGDLAPAIIATLPPPPKPPCKVKDQSPCTQIVTAIGDVSTDPCKFISQLFGILLSFSGGIALLLIMQAGYRYMTSQGKPEAVQQAREQLIAAIVGLIFMIFSFVILQTIGVDILRIPTGGSASSACVGGAANNGSTGTIQKGGACDVAGNTLCAAPSTCKSTGGRAGTCQ